MTRGISFKGVSPIRRRDGWFDDILMKPEVRLFRGVVDLLFPEIGVDKPDLYSIAYKLDAAV